MAAVRVGIPLVADDILEARALRNKMLRPGGFKTFVRHFWDEVEPRALIWNWHLDVLCDLLEALGRKVFNRLLINIPPGMGKSLVCGVLWPAWMWALDPTWRSIFGTHDKNLAFRDAVKCRNLVKSDEYKRIFRPDWLEDEDRTQSWDFDRSQDTKHLYANTAGGARYSTSVGAAVTGFRGGAVVVDDPLDAQKTPSEIALNEHVEWFGNLATRIDDVQNSQWLVIMQRLCEGDLSDHLIEKGGWVHLRLPAEYDPEDPCTIELFGEVVWEDPRTEKGEPLFPQIQPRNVLETLRVYLGDRRFEPQYNQRVVLLGGGIIKYTDARWHDMNPLTELRDRMVQIVLSGDLTYMRTEAKQRDVQEKRSYNNLDVWGTDGRNFYLLDTARGRWEYAEFKDVFIELIDRWGIWTVLLEQAAVADVAEQDLRKLVPDIDLVPAVTSKEARVQVAARYWRLGRVWLPNAEWAREWMIEVARFGIALHSDRADTMSQAIIHFTMQANYESRGASNPYATQSAPRKKSNNVDMIDVAQRVANMVGRYVL